MKYQMKKLLLCLFLFPLQALAQTEETGSISMTVLDDEKKPLPDVSIRVLTASDSLIAKIGITDTLGRATIEDLKPGDYFLEFLSFGFDTYRTAVISINAKNLNASLDQVMLVKMSGDLGEVTIMDKKPFIERQLDKLVLNVENSITAMGSSVLDVLERAPGVIIANGTSINLKGKQGVIVMIDGKPSPLGGEDLINYLRSIPSANIQKIEIITNPSAKYDAAGNAGIINIVFKKDQRLGFNGNFSLSYGQGMYGKPSGATNFNYRNKKLNFFGNYSYSQPTNFTRFYINRKFFNSDRSVQSVFDQDSFIKSIFHSHNSKVGVDYYASPKTVIGVMFNGNFFTQDRDGFTDARITNSEDVLLYTSGTKTLLDERKINGFGNFNVKHTFDSTGRELTFDADYGKIDWRFNQDFTTNYYDAAGAPTFDNSTKTIQSGGITILSAKTDYLHPIKGGKIEAGLKSSYVETDNDIQFYNVFNNNNVFDSTRSNHFIYQENINAAYVNYAREFKKIDFQLGLRAEHTLANGKQITTGQNFDRNYLYLFPSIFFNRKFSDNHIVSLSYSRRIDRPSYHQLNPFRIFTDPYTSTVGDPQLRPVLTHSADLSYTLKGAYVFSVGYAHSKDVITDVFIQNDTTKASYQTPANIQNYDQVYFSASIPFSVKQWMNSSLNGSVYMNKYSSKFLGGNLNNNSLSFDVNMTNTFMLGNGWAAELSGYYQSQQAWGLFTIKNLAQITCGVQKTTKSKMTTFKLSVSDITYTNRIAVVVVYQNQDWHTSRTWDSRVLTFSFVQRFGKNTVAQSRRRNTGVEDVKSRTN